MPGMIILPNKLVLLLIIMATFLLPGSGEVFASPGQGSVAILLSDSDEAYRQQATTFSEDLGLPTQVFNLHGDIQNDPGLKDKLLAGQPILIYALGAKAAFAAKLWTKERQDIPVLFAMVLNWQRYDLLEGNSNIAGIAAEISPGTQFVNMTMFSPAVKRIGLLYSPYSATLLVLARKEAAQLGLELVAEPIERSKEFRSGFKKLSGRVDAFWVLNDPVLYTLENLGWLEERCLKEKLLCVGQNQNLAKMGLTLTVNPDVTQIGIQSAALARNILLHGQKVSEIKVMEPLSTQLFLNLKTAERIGLAIPQQAQNMATTVLGQ